MCGRRKKIARNDLPSIKSTIKSNLLRRKGAKIPIPASVSSKKTRKMSIPTSNHLHFRIPTSNYLQMRSRSIIPRHSNDAGYQPRAPEGRRRLYVWLASRLPQMRIGVMTVIQTQ